jgi:hypothetical protein
MLNVLNAHFGIGAIAGPALIPNPPMNDLSGAWT